MTFSSKIEIVPIDDVKPAPDNARTHSAKQINDIARSIKKNSFVGAIAVSDDLVVIAGNGRLAAAKKLGFKTIPVIRLSHLTKAELKAYALTDNKSALDAGWNERVLAEQLQELLALDIEVPGFDEIEIDLALDRARAVSSQSKDDTDIEKIPAHPGQPVTRPGDLWELGRHRLICGDALDGAVFKRLMADQKAQACSTDPVYNVPVIGHVSGNGKILHDEFACGVGEMSKPEFTSFLSNAFKNVASFCKEGAIIFSFMDWRHFVECHEAGMSAFTEFKNLCVWNKKNAGMGTFYRSKHELILVFKYGTATHINNFGLGETGRHRSNVWDYAGVNSFKSERDAELAYHPTVKPVALIADALLDVTKRGGIVLDPFGGSGSTLIAAQKVGRRAGVIELEGKYCDVTIARFQKMSGEDVTLVGSGKTFEAVCAERAP